MGEEASIGEYDCWLDARHNTIGGFTIFARDKVNIVAYRIEGDYSRLCDLERGAKYSLRYRHKSASIEGFTEIRKAIGSSSKPITIYEGQAAYSVFAGFKPKDKMLLEMYAKAKGCLTIEETLFNENDYSEYIYGLDACGCKDRLPSVSEVEKLKADCEQCHADLEQNLCAQRVFNSTIGDMHNYE